MNKQEILEQIDELKQKIEQIEKEVKSNKDEEAKKGARQKPEINEIYYFLNSLGNVCHKIWLEDNEDLFRFNSGNCFKTEKEALDYKENLLTKQALKDLALELNNGVEIDWENGEQDKYYIHINNNFKPIYLGHDPYHINIGQIYCLNGDFLKIAKDRIGEDKLIKLIKSGV